ncbi:hypothetical protein KFE94_06275 [bacterium SCSIO 12643]|nr:hypothetical protein KFE94_06275 [bacterium SCSIO 12643]
MFKSLKKSAKNNWKYIFREILLLFIGINLAIWFNNWNESKKINQKKTIAIKNIVEEIGSNKKELNTALHNYETILKAYTEYKGLYNQNTTELITTPVKMKELQSKHPNFFIINDSISIDEYSFRYLGTTKVEMELPLLTDIAWKTTVSTNISSELSFECMYQLENVYNLQAKVVEEVSKASNSLKKETIDELIRILKFSTQLGTQLQKEYNETERKILNCN